MWLMFRALKLKLFGRRNIPGTFLRADMVKQPVIGNSTFSHAFVDSYWSEEIVCRDCREVFVQTAEEKKKYYEVEGHQFYTKFNRCKKCHAKR
jgi:uncharacterized protein with PIN domain